VNKCLHTVASSWTFLLTLNHDARNHEFKIYPDGYDDDCN